MKYKLVVCRVHVRQILFCRFDSFFWRSQNESKIYLHFFFRKYCELEIMLAYFIHLLRVFILYSCFKAICSNLSNYIHDVRLATVLIHKMTMNLGKKIRQLVPSCMVDFFHCALSIHLDQLRRQHLEPKTTMHN